MTASTMNFTDTNTTTKTPTSGETRSSAYLSLTAYATWYWNVHGYTSLVVCIFGVTTNILNIAILTRKSMRTAINIILTGMAVSDVMTMLLYIPNAVHFYLMTDLTPTPERYSYGWTIFMAVYGCLSIITHTISIWLAVCMSAVRYMFLRSHGAQYSLDNTKAVILVSTVYLTAVIVFIPYYCLFDIIPVYRPEWNATLYQLKGIQIGPQHTGDVMNVLNTWIFIILGKLAPCLLISIFGGLLLHTLQESKKLTQNLKSASCEDRLRQHRRTTIMLLAIILMFVIAELPSAILIFISVFVEGFFNDYYMLFADTLDILALINESANFVMYCAMSQQFRQCLCAMCESCPKQCCDLVKCHGKHRSDYNMVNGNGAKRYSTTSATRV
jgi:hypothetical protein